MGIIQIIILTIDLSNNNSKVSIDYNTLMILVFLFPQNHDDVLSVGESLCFYITDAASIPF